MAESLVGTSGTAGRLADGEAQPARLESLRIAVPDHQPCGLGANDLAAKMKKLAQKPAHIRRGRVRPSPRNSQLPPVGTIPVPLLGLRIATP